jgi:hypothetical protein
LLSGRPRQQLIDIVRWWPNVRRCHQSLRTEHFSVERNRADGAFDGVVVELDAAIDVNSSGWFTQLFGLGRKTAG